MRVGKISLLRKYRRVGGTKFQNSNRNIYFTIVQYTLNKYQWQFCIENTSYYFNKAYCM